MMMSSKPNQHLQHEYKIASPGGTAQKKLTFLPMLCSSSSTKQVKLSHRRCTSSSSVTSSTISDDPSSPKVGCMGQVKRNNKVIGFPSIISFTSSTSSNNSNSSNSSNSTHHHAIKCHEPNNYTSNNIVKYHKLKRFFSTKSPTSVISAAKSGTHKGRIERKNVGNVVCRATRSNEGIVCDNKSYVDKGSLVNLIEMDPPLPVVKKVIQHLEEGNNSENMSTLWKRRLGGAPLKIQVIQQNISLLPVNTV